MANMERYSKKAEFPSQTENRRKWILDTVRANQMVVINLLMALHDQIEVSAETIFNQMNKMDRDALLQPGGILTDEQIKLLEG